MEFKTEKKALLDAITAAGRAAGGRSTNPVLYNMLIELSGDQLLATGTNQELVVTSKAAVSGAEDGSTAVSASLFVGIIKSLEDGEVAVTVDDEGVHISSGESEFDLMVFNPEDFPKMALSDLSEPAIVPADNLLTAITHVARAASTDETRPVLTGVLVSPQSESVHFVTTDSYRLALRELPELSGMIGEVDHVLIPATAAKEVARYLPDLENVAVRVGSQWAVFVLGATTIATRLIEGDFPNYQSLIPDTHAAETTADKDALLSAAKRVDLLSVDDAPFRVAIDCNGIELSTSSLNVGNAKERIAAKHDGEPVTLAFSPARFIDGIESVEGDLLILSTNGKMKPVIFSGQDESDGIYLLMPSNVSV